MPTIQNSKGDYTKFELGGIGGDNVQGTVCYKEGNPADKATVKLKNLSNDESAECVTGIKGWYDQDLNAETGHNIEVDISWKDSNNVTHEINGRGTL
jgi:hypothetical protein